MHAGAGGPRRAAVLRVAAEGLPQLGKRSRVDDEHVAVARRARTGLRSARSAGSDTAPSRSRRASRTSAGTRLSGRGHGRVRDADGPAVPQPGAEVGLQTVGGTDAADPTPALLAWTGALRTSACISKRCWPGTVCSSARRAGARPRPRRRQPGDRDGARTPIATSTLCGGGSARDTWGTGTGCHHPLALSLGHPTDDSGSIG